MAGDSSAFGSVALGLASAASWGAGDFAGGLASRRTSALGVAASSQGVGVVLLVAVSLLIGESVPAPGSLGWAVLAGASGSMGLLALYTALASGRMGIAAPVSGVVGAVVPVLVGAALHGPPGFVRIAGFALALIGVWLLTATAGGVEGATRKELVLPIVAGVSFGLFLVFIHQAGGTGVLWLVTAARATSLGVLTAIGVGTRTLRLPARPALGTHVSGWNPRHGWQRPVHPGRAGRAAGRGRRAVLPLSRRHRGPGVPPAPGAAHAAAGDRRGRDAGGHRVRVLVRDAAEPVVVALVGAPYDGAATLGWPGARYAPDEVRRHLAWMRMRVQDGRIYWVDQDRVVPWRPEQLVDAGDAAIVPHDLAATLISSTMVPSMWERKVTPLGR